jgi:hypothetical protein
MSVRHAVLLGAVLLSALAIASRAQAFRPFDGTDASVADTGEAGIELQPAGLLREGSETRLVAPATIIDLGIAPNWEVNAQGQAETPIGHSRGRTSITDTGIFAKGVLRPGFLQDRAGPSVATEFGVLLPQLNGLSGAGALWDVIVSEGGSWGAVHLNIQPELATDRHFDLFLDLIIEGPRTWPVRPVAEIFMDRDFGGARTRSALLGAIWQVRDNLAFDIGLRGARVDDHSVAELRAGLTFAFAAR